MPRVNIYIRKEDDEFWNEIQDKPSFIHDAIRVQRQSLSGSIYTQYPPGDPPKCATCGNYHFEYDKKAMAEWHEPTITPAEDSI